MSFWEKSLNNAKLIASTILVLSSLVVGSWTLLTSTFLTTADAKVLIKKLDKETSYNKAFRLETRIFSLMKLKEERELSPLEKKSLERLKRDLNSVDEHIEDLESK